MLRKVGKLCHDTYSFVETIQEAGKAKDDSLDQGSSTFFKQTLLFGKCGCKSPPLKTGEDQKKEACAFASVELVIPSENR